MNKYPLSLIILALIFIGLTFSCYTAHATDSGIEVSGEGSISVVPDDFSLSLRITERGRVTSKLKVLVDKKSDLVIQAANKLGIKNSEINSAQVNLRVIDEKPAITVQGLANQIKTNSQNSLDNANNKQNTLFEVSRTIQVNFTKIDDYDHFLAELVKINVSHISSLSMNVTQQDKYYQQALLLAITQAKNKAKKMIEHTGGRLGQLVYLKEQSTNYYQPRFAQAMMSDSGPINHTSLVGSQTIKASVLIKFSILK